MFFKSYKYQKNMNMVNNTFKEIEMNYYKIKFI